jgi:hypothetical protein
MKKLFLILILLLVTISYSQEEYSHNYYWNISDNSEAIIGVNKCKVLVNSDANSEVLDSLKLGTKVIVLKTTENLFKNKGINVSWVEIKFKNKSGETKTGYLWKGFLALNFIKKQGLTYLTTIDKIENFKSGAYINDRFSISVKILNNKNQLLNQISIKKPLSESTYFENKTIGSLGLSKLKNIYRISFSGESCGVPTLYYYFGWNGNKLLLLPEKMNVADADVYYHSEEFIFPSEKGGKPDSIIKKIEEAELIEETSGIYNITNGEEIFKWNGEKTILFKKSKLKKSKKKL